MGGTAGRMRKYSEAFSRELDVEWTDYTKGERYGIFKAGPILCISVSFIKLFLFLPHFHYVRHVIAFVSVCVWTRG